VAADGQEIVPIALPGWAKRLLRKSPERVRFLLAGPEIERHPVKLSVAG
jgi:hypothetical protein